MLPFRRSTAAGRDRGAFPSPEGRSVCFPSPARAVVKVLYKLAPLYFQRAPTEAFPPERSDATLLYNPWHRGPSGPMDAIRPSAAQRQAPSGIQESTAPPTGIYWHSSHLLFLPRSFVSLEDDEWEAGLPSRQSIAVPAPIPVPAEASAPAASAATTLGPCVSTGPYALLPRSGRPLQEYRKAPPRRLVFTGTPLTYYSYRDPSFHSG